MVPQSPTWTFTGPVIYNSGISSGTAAPANSPIGIGGSRAWESTSNSGENVWLSARDDNKVLIYDTATFTRLGEIAADSPSGIFFTARANRIGF